MGLQKKKMLNMNRGGYLSLVLAGLLLLSCANGGFGMRCETHLVRILVLYHIFWISFPLRLAHISRPAASSMSLVSAVSF